MIDGARCSFPLCECDLENNGRHECRRPPRKYFYEVSHAGDCMILDPDGNSIGTAPTVDAAKRFIADLNEQMVAA